MIHSEYESRCIFRQHHTSLSNCRSWSIGHHSPQKTTNNIPNSPIMHCKMQPLYCSCSKQSCMIYFSPVSICTINILYRKASSPSPMSAFMQCHKTVLVCYIILCICTRAVYTLHICICVHIYHYKNNFSKHLVTTVA